MANVVIAVKTWHRFFEGMCKSRIRNLYVAKDNAKRAMPLLGVAPQKACASHSREKQMRLVSKLSEFLMVGTTNNLQNVISLSATLR